MVLIELIIGIGSAVIVLGLEKGIPATNRWRKARTFRKGIFADLEEMREDHLKKYVHSNNQREINFSEKNSHIEANNSEIIIPLRTEQMTKEKVPSRFFEAYIDYGIIRPIQRELQQRGYPEEFNTEFSAEVAEDFAIEALEMIDAETAF